VAQYNHIDHDDKWNWNFNSIISLSEFGQYKEYIRAASSKGEPHSSETSFMLLVLQQQRMLDESIDTVTESEKLQT
jgi:hypothetical protein